MAFQEAIKSTGEKGMQVPWTDPTYLQPSFALQLHVDS